MQPIKTKRVNTSFGLTKYEQVSAVSNFLDSLGLVPSCLVTKEVFELIFKSWQREFQREDLEEIRKQQMLDTIIRYSKMRRKRKKVLDNMLPLNFETLFDDVFKSYQ